ncbi:MAG: (2Fe-2S)-binding protein [Candidatus Neomarinimicrobiota bacterium]|jgi:carbon-monoxide dehydrogenase small subunit|nr:(2Fe-2S)-binding protein [Candidatus Neomarinimicrobiota bacterium]MDD3965741.1 (2Fe-2S)-binding protein [Candidatus Neomarinimicrobiota bacterium]MDX9780181.1 (2Fe-2S)-binding protein [bacterium]
MKIEFTLNGEKKHLDVHAATRLLDVLRGHFGLIGVKEGCGEGECGACMVLINGRAMNSCMIPMGNLEGKNVITPEAFCQSERGRIIEDAFMEAGAVQCGFCTPGFIMATASLLNANPDPDEAQIREALSGNLCRCTGYTAIVRAVRIAAGKGAGAC